MSPLALIEPFSALEDYPEEFQGAGRFEGIPALANTGKSFGRPLVNFNHFAYIGIADQYFREAKYIYIKYPKVYLRKLASGWINYFKPPSLAGHDIFIQSAPQLTQIFNGWDYAVYGKLPLNWSKLLGRYTQHEVFLFLLLGLPLMVVFGFYFLFGKGSALNFLDRNGRLVLGYMLFSILFIALSGNAISILENYRFRFNTSPFYLTILGLAGEFLLYRRKPRLKI